jgi:hypothetical protein
MGFNDDLGYGSNRFLAYSNRMTRNAGGTIGQTFIWAEAMGAKMVGSNEAGNRRQQSVAAAK